MSDKATIQDLINFISKKWLYEIISVLKKGPMRFSDLVESVGEISNKVLSDRLKELYDYKLIDKVVYSLIPLNMKYLLTEKGSVIPEIFDQLDKYTVIIDNMEG